MTRNGPPQDAGKRSLLQRLLESLSSSGQSRPPLSHAELRHVEEALRQFVLSSPEIIRATLVSCDGVLMGNFADQAGIAADRISAMSAAILSLGERICRELGSGNVRYSLIAGDETLQLLVVLSKDYALELEVRKNVSVDAVLDTVKQSAEPLLRALHLVVELDL